MCIRDSISMVGTALPRLFFLVCARLVHCPPGHSCCGTSTQLLHERSQHPALCSTTQNPGVRYEMDHWQRKRRAIWAAGACGDRWNARSSGKGAPSWLTHGGLSTAGISTPIAPSLHKPSAPAHLTPWLAFGARGPGAAPELNARQVTKWRRCTLRAAPVRRLLRWTNEAV